MVYCRSLTSVISAQILTPIIALSQYHSSHFIIYMANLFTVATVDWFRDHADHVIQHLNSSLQTNPLYANRAIVWRPDNVTNWRGDPMLSTEEPLIRWDTRRPGVVFQRGFEPGYVPVLPPDEDFDHLNSDVSTHVSEHPGETLFVSTTRTRAGPNGNPYI